MAAVIGSARTLQARWRELRPEQREAFLAVIADETTRLSALVGDVLDTSRIEAGTFGYRFGDVDLAEVLRDSVAAAEIGQDEVQPLDRAAGRTAERPRRRGAAAPARRQPDLERDQVLGLGRRGRRSRPAPTTATSSSASATRDPGSAPSTRRRSSRSSAGSPGSAKPGTGLGLFLSRSFAEAHGGSLDVESTPGEGAVFTLRLPVG